MLESKKTYFVEEVLNTCDAGGNLWLNADSVKERRPTKKAGVKTAASPSGNHYSSLLGQSKKPFSSGDFLRGGLAACVYVAAVGSAELVAAEHYAYAVFFWLIFIVSYILAIKGERDGWYQ